jgi:hypothetical protein
MTASDIVTSAREFVALDTNPGSRRHTDAQCIKWVNLGIRRIYRIRPDALYDSSVTTSTPDDIDDLADTILLRKEFEAALIYYVLHWFYIKDSQDANGQQRARDYLAFFEDELRR